MIRSYLSHLKARKVTRSALRFVVAQGAGGGQFLLGVSCTDVWSIGLSLRAGDVYAFSIVAYTVVPSVCCHHSCAKPITFAHQLARLASL